MKSDPATKSRPLIVTCWGSYPGQAKITPETPQIIIRAALGERLFRGLPMVRMKSAEEFREFIQNEEGWGKSQQKIATLLRAPPDMEVEMMDVDEIYTGYTLGQDRSSGKKKRYRYASRSFHNQDLRKNHWKKIYGAPVESLRPNNRTNRLAPPPPPKLRALPETLRPAVFQILLLFLFICCFLGVKLGLKASYSSKLGKAMVYFGLFWGTFVLYTFYRIFYISIRKTLGMFGVQQGTRPPGLITLPAIIQPKNVQVLLFLLSLLSFAGVELHLSARFTILALYALYLTFYIFLQYQRTFGIQRRGL